MNRAKVGPALAPVKPAIPVHPTTGITNPGPRSSPFKSPATAPAVVHDVLRSLGHPLDSSTRAFMKPRFGRDFSRIRIHTGEKAAESAAAVNASAYAVPLLAQNRPRQGRGRIQTR